MGCKRAAYTGCSRAMKMKKFLLLISSFLPLAFAFASALANPSCKGGVDQVSIEYKGIQGLNVWGKESSFASFDVSNRSSKEVKLPLDGTQNPVIVHGQYVELQSRPIALNAVWEPDAVVLEEFIPPRKWMVIGPGAGMMFFLDVIGPMSDSERSKSREYRVSLKDTDGCQYLSEPFRTSVQ